MHSFKNGLKSSLPIAAGYTPIAFAFGVAAVQSGLSPWLTMMISVFVFAGGSQFVLISLLAAGGSLFSVVPTVVLLNARHVLYGRALLKAMGDAPRRRNSFFLAFGLTDEVFATAITRIENLPAQAREHWFIGLELGAYLSWLLGTLLGCLIGAEILSRYPALNAALSFVLPALFFSILLSLKLRGAWLPAAVSALVTALLLIKMSAALAIPLGLLAGAIAGAIAGAMESAKDDLAHTAPTHSTSNSFPSKDAHDA